MCDKPGMDKNYIKNVSTSKGRTLRIELVGGASNNELHFLDGMALFMAGTLSRGDENHTSYVAELMGRMVKGLLAKIRKEMGG